MTFDQYWQKLIDANPELVHFKISMTIDIKNFKKLMARSYEVGQGNPIDKKQIAKDFASVSKPDSIKDFMGMFGIKDNDN